MEKRRRVIDVPANDYQPTKAEMDEPVMLDGAEGMTVDQVVQRLLRQVQMREVPSAEGRKRRRQTS